jgi:hypothetical protein
MNDITVVALSIGEATTARAIASATRQSLPAREIITIRNVTPFHKAMNLGASRVATEFFVQLDADMILDQHCLESLRACMRENVGLVLGSLRDSLMGRVGWVKMFRTECFAAVKYRDIVSSDLAFKDDISRLGWDTAIAIRPVPGAPRQLWHTFGEHRPEYTLHYTYSKYLLEGRRYRYRKAPTSLRWHMKRLRQSGHPMALIAEIALAHGIFIRAQTDLLKPYVRDGEFELLEEFLEGRGFYRVSRMSVVPVFSTNQKKTFHKAYRLGSNLRRAAAFRAFTRCMEWLSRTRDPLAQVAKIGLCHGLFAKTYSENACAAECQVLEEFVPRQRALALLHTRFRMAYRRSVRALASALAVVRADRMLKSAAEG